MRLVATGIGLVVVGMTVFEVTMEPGPNERVGALLLFGLTAGGIAMAATVLPRLARRLRSLRVTVVILGVTALLILVIALVISGREMFLSPHDLSLLWVLMGFGLVASLAFGLTVSGPLTEDLLRISDTSSAIAAGDLAARTRVERVDEAGRVARDVDLMAEVLEDAHDRRIREEAARRELLAAIGHDLRTPLASMRAAVEALQDGLARDPGRYLEALGTDVDALSRLVEDIFLMARLESGDIALQAESIDLTEVVDEAIELFAPIASARHVSLRLEADSRVVAHATAEAVARVIRNLLDNAIRFSPEHAEVRVQVSNGDTASCRVLDEGPGFSPDFVFRAFDDFSREDASRERRFGGAGLGLAIARSYVDALGGEIWAEAGPGGRVGFDLPVVRQSPNEETTTSKRSLSSSG